MDELQLLKGTPISVHKGVKVHPFTIGEITDIGQNIYNSYISSILIDKTILNNSQYDDLSQEALSELNEISDLDFILALSINNGDISDVFVEALSYFLKCQVRFDFNYGIIINNENEEIILDSSTFDEIKKIISKQNFLKDNDSSKFKPANAKARALLEKLNKAKENIQKQNKEEGLKLHDIISIVATYSNDINMLSVWNLTVYQLYNCYLRLIIWDDYHNKYQLIPHSSDINSLDIKHWAIDIDSIK